LAVDGKVKDVFSDSIISPKVIIEVVHSYPPSAARLQEKFFTNPKIASYW